MPSAREPSVLQKGWTGCNLVVVMKRGQASLRRSQAKDQRGRNCDRATGSTSQPAQRSRWKSLPN